MSCGGSVQTTMTTIAPAQTPTQSTGRAKEHEAVLPFTGRRLAWCIVSVAFDARSYIGLLHRHRHDARRDQAAYVAVGLALVVGRLFLRGHHARHGTLFASLRSEPGRGPPPCSCRPIRPTGSGTWRKIAHTRPSRISERWTTCGGRCRPQNSVPRHAGAGRRAAVPHDPGTRARLFLRDSLPEAHRAIAPARAGAPGGASGGTRSRWAALSRCSFGVLRDRGVMTQQRHRGVMATALVLPFALWNAMVDGDLFCATRIPSAHGSTATSMSGTRQSRNSPTPCA